MGRLHLPRVSMKIKERTCIEHPAQRSLNGGAIKGSYTLHIQPCLASPKGGESCRNALMAS